MKKYIKIVALCLALAVGASAIPDTVAPLRTEAAESLKLNKSKLTMGLGDSYVLKLTGANKPVWKSSNGKIASVKNGKVIAKKTGKVTITASCKGKTYKCNILIKAPKISNAKVSMTVGTKKQLKILNTVNRITWASTNKSVATVDKKGLVTAKKAGTAKIVGKLHGKKYISVITVKKNATKPVALNKKTAKLLMGDFLQLKLSNANSNAIIWKTSDKAVASVSNGKVVPKKAGKVTITAVYRKKLYKCTVTIPKPVITPEETSVVFLGDSLMLKMTNVKGTVTWKSSDTSVATVNSVGKIAGKGAGKATISAKIGSYTVKKTIEVVEKDNYQKDEMRYILGDVFDLNNVQLLFYTKEFFKLEGNSLKAMKSGTGTVTVKYSDGSITEWTIRIEKAWLSTEMYDSIKLKVGETTDLLVNENKLPVIWASSNSAVATVNSQGIVTGKKEGTAIITASVGWMKFNCKIVVVKARDNSSENKPEDDWELIKNPSTAVIDPEARAERFNWKSPAYADMKSLYAGELVHGEKVQIIVDNAPDIKFSVDSKNSALISVTSEGVVTAKADKTKSEDENKVGMAEVIAKSGDKTLTFLVDVKKAEFVVQKKKIYNMYIADYLDAANECLIGKYNPEIPKEAKRDLFNYFFGQNYKQTKAKFEILYGEPSPYLDFGDYIVTYHQLQLKKDVTSPLESADRMDAVFGWLRNKPDYVKVREVSRWLSGHIKSGDYSSDGTYLGIKTAGSTTVDVMFETIMWYLDVECEEIMILDMNATSIFESKTAWFTLVQVDGYWYAVSILLGNNFQYNGDTGHTFASFNTNYVQSLASYGYFNTHPYGTKYLYGYRTLAFASREELDRAIADKSSNLWKIYNEDHGVAVNLPYKNICLGEDIGIGPSYILFGTYQNPLVNVANLNDKSRMSYVYTTNEQSLPNTAPLPPLSNYIK